MITRWVMQSESNRSWSKLSYNGQNISDEELISKDGERAVIVYREEFEDRCVITLLPAERKKINKDYKGRIIKSDIIEKEKYFVIFKSLFNNIEYVTTLSYSFEESCQIIRLYSSISFEKAIFLAQKKGLLLDEIIKK